MLVSLLLRQRPGIRDDRSLSQRWLNGGWRHNGYTPLVALFVATRYAMAVVVGIERQ